MSFINAVFERTSCEELEKVVISDDKEKFFQVGVLLPPQEKKEPMVFLKKNIGVFAWSAYEAPGVDPTLICHHLNFNPTFIPKKQQPRCSSKEHSKAVKEKVSSLSKLGLLRRCFSPSGWPILWW